MTAAAPVSITVESFGDSAVMVTIPHPDPATRRAGIIRVRERLLADRPPGVLDIVSGLESLLVEFDPLTTTPEHIAYAARLLAAAPSTTDPTALSPVRHFAIPVVFDAETGPDLASVADEVGLTPGEVIDAIAASTFTICLLGAAMAPMMDGLRVPRPVRRRAEPRTDVAPGAIMIAGTNAIIQPFPGPTGWRVVGRTPHTIVDISRPDPVAFGPGDTVRFVPVTRTEARPMTGTFLLPTGVTA